jgi:hypothetical protein
MTLKPIPIRVLRHACPHCGRTHSRPGRAREHMARCWFNTDAKGCKTCKHFEPAWGSPAEPEIGYGGDYAPEFCHVGVDLTGRPACERCGGYGDVPGEELGMTECPDCAGDGAEIKPGPIVGCELWEPFAAEVTP